MVRAAPWRESGGQRCRRGWRRPDHAVLLGRVSGIFGRSPSGMFMYGMQGCSGRRLLAIMHRHPATASANAPAPTDGIT
jgi:hypothetical protein